MPIPVYNSRQEIVNPAENNPLKDVDMMDVEALERARDEVNKQESFVPSLNQLELEKARL